MESHRQVINLNVIHELQVPGLYNNGRLRSRLRMKHSSRCSLTSHTRSTKMTR